MIAVLYALGMAVLTVYGLNLLWLSVNYASSETLRPDPVPPADQLPDPPSSWPRVTVQVPLYNEKYVAERIIDACANLDYPADKLEIQVLDDSTDQTVDIARHRVAYWQQRGCPITHVHRTHREGYKAGALQNGMNITSSELLAVFDADFVPRADFLRRAVPYMEDSSVGMVQARWKHLNADTGLLTQIQAMSLDAHFAVEQNVRQSLGYFINFNGTAGIWRRSCIEDAGGWEGDTLTEDLDLSYRAQLRGWNLQFLPRLSVPAELPVDVNGLRTQQFRWAKGSWQTALKLLGPLWTSDQPVRTRIEGTIHLTAHAVFPCTLIVALSHAPLFVLESFGYGPGNLYFGVMGLGLWAFAGVLLSQIFAQRDLYADWVARLRNVIWFMAGSMGLALNNTQAVLEALIGKPSDFVRTPKFRARSDSTVGQWVRKGYASGSQVPAMAWFEALAALYCAAGVIVLIALGEWVAVPFQLLFTAGFGLISGFTFRQAWVHRRAR